VGVNADEPEKLAAAVGCRSSADSKLIPPSFTPSDRIEAGGQQKIVGFLTGALPNLFTEADARALAAKT